MSSKEKANTDSSTKENQGTLALAFPDFASHQAVRHERSVDAALDVFRRHAGDGNEPVRSIHCIPARQAQTVAYPENIQPKLHQALLKRGITELYTHQSDAFEHVQAGRNIVVITPTASGKTLCYNLPVLNTLLQDPSARAMYLFPTKALAEDQLHEFQSAVDSIGADIRAFTYDGDTPQDVRKAIRERANVVFTNPDMLHSGVLPHHTKWAKYFENLKYFVVDELHYYRGVYGSHFANLLRRFRRICEFYGSSPQFICSSATIANPKELAEALTGHEFALVDRNGAPAGEKYFVFYNPPVVNKQLGIRRSYLHETRRVALEMIQRQQQTLVFANSRLATEVLLSYLKAGCEKIGVSSDAVRGYRGGYLPRERREIESKLRNSDIRAVVATNALELGIDIGSLDAVVLAGYPGTIASTLQRAGRAGRRASASLAVFVASSNPLDQYMVENPEYFFGRSPEHAHINPDNLEIALNHLRCAAFELPIQEGEVFGSRSASDTRELCRFLEETGFLHHSGGAWHWTSDTYPADAVSLRAITSDNFIVIDITGANKVIAEVSFPTALTALHEKAIYLHEARQYQVERFDYEGRKAYVRRVDCDYFTDAIDYTQVKIIDEYQAAPAGLATIAHGDVRVNRQIVGWKKIKFFTLENIGAGHLSMPEQEMHTTSFWIHFPAAFSAQFPDLSATERQSGLQALANGMLSIASLLLMCDPRDLAVAFTEAMVQGPALFEPNLYLYDAYPGGIGQSAPLFQLAPQLFDQTLNLLDSCPCETGCPSCVGAVGNVGERGKEIASLYLKALQTKAAAELN